MKNNWFKKSLVKCVAGLMVVSMLAGCGQSNSGTARYEATKSESSYSSSVNGYVSYGDAAVAEYDNEDLWNEGTEVAMADQGSGNSNYNNTSASNRKLIKNVNMNVETQEYEVLMKNVENRVKELGGYIQNLDSYNGSDYNVYRNNGNNYNYRRYANLTVRIPAAKLDDFVNSVSELANIVNRRESVEDVTLQYVDVKSHKEALEVEQARLLELLARAELLEDIITLENRLTNIRYQIEAMESSLRTYDDLVDYSTVTLRIDEVEVYTPVIEEPVVKTKWEIMVEGFVDSLKDIADDATNFGVWFVIHLPYLVIWAIVIVVVVIVLKRSIKKNKEKSAKRAEEMVSSLNLEASPLFSAGKPEVKAEVKSDEKADVKEEKGKK